MKNNNRRTGIIRRLTAMLLMIACLGMTACGSRPLSERIIGEWEGELDIAAILSKELSSQLGFDIPLDPKKCDVSLNFNEDGTFSMEIDVDQLMDILGDMAEPISDTLMGYDTGAILDMLMAFLKTQLPAESGIEYGTYTVDDEEETVAIMFENAGSDVLTTEGGKLIMYDSAYDLTVKFSK
jgi:hypothetical protein